MPQRGHDQPVRPMLRLPRLIKTCCSGSIMAVGKLMFDSTCGFPHWELDEHRGTTLFEVGLGFASQPGMQLDLSCSWNLIPLLQTRILTLLPAKMKMSGKGDQVGLIDGSKVVCWKGFQVDVKILHFSRLKISTFGRTFKSDSGKPSHIST